MESYPLALEHKELLFKRLRAVDIPISEYSFANLYLFRNTHNYEILSDGEIFVKGTAYDGSTYLMPTSDVRTLDTEYLAEIIATVDHMYPVPEKWLPAFPTEFYSADHSEDDSDYIYSCEKLATYAGKKMHKKKNLLNFFRKHYEHRALPLTDNLTGDALLVLEAWQKESGQPASATDYEACRESLERSEELVLCGGIYYAQDEPAGFLLGEELNAETYALHFAKGLTKFKGIYQYMFNNFAGILPASYRYINMEQDLGKEALRHSKESYMPKFKLKKFKIRLRQ